ncbi:hypothetical protein EBR43_04720 [bacterium]|nr:hypothetical protein [bacterium]
MKNNTNANTDTLPKLACLVTGKTRTSNIKYLEAKALRLGVNVDVLIKNYVSREAIKLLRTGKSFDEIRGIVGTVEGYTPSTPSIKNDELIRLNSKGSSKS